MYEKPRFLNCGDTAVTVEIDDNINENTNNMVVTLADKLMDSDFRGIIEVIPAYRSFTVFYNPLEFVLSDFKTFINENYKINELKGEKTGKVIEIPVLYGDEFGLDINRVASYNNMTTEKVIKIHTSGSYRVYMLGFTPGFPYLGGMSHEISTPRLEIPRQLVPGGSVGIAGDQTGIYPLASPGGWNIIGRTPIKLFQPLKDSPTLLNAGDLIKFVPIDLVEYNKILSAQGECEKWEK